MIKQTEKKQYWKLIALGLFLLIVFAVSFRFFSMFSIQDSSYNFDKKDDTRIYPGFPVIQKFRAEKNNLNQINIDIDNADLKDSDRMIFEMNDESCDRVIAKTEMTKFSQRFPIFDRFSFPAIADSQGKTYCFKIRYLPGNENLKKSDYPKVSVDLQMLFVEPFENTRPGSNEKASSLVMRPAYTNGSVVADLATLRDRISQDKPWFLKNAHLTVIFTTFLLLSVVLVVGLILL